MDRRTLLKRCQRASWLLCGACLVYLFLRFESLTLPAEGCSPLLRYRAGVSLLLDRWPGELHADEAVLFKGPDADLNLGLIESLREQEGRQQLWIVVDDPDCPGTSSADCGWLRAEDVSARVVFAWPF